MGLVNGRGRFSTPHSSETPRPIFMKLEICNTSWTWPSTQNFRGLRRCGWSGQIASLTHESFCPFFRFFATPTGRITGHTPTRNTSLYVVLVKVKIGTLSWRSMENFSRPNSETVSLIQFKLGIGNDHPSGITWHHFKVTRSVVKVTT